MPLLQTPPSIRSPKRLRSFHLSPAGTSMNPKYFTSPQTSLTVPPVPKNITIPLQGSTITTLAVIASLVFISTISISFIGVNVDEPYFRLLLDSTAQLSPGIVLLGENVDVDIDEPSITVRWSIIACGAGFVLSDSTGVHGSESCGLPAEPLYIHVDNSQEPKAIYDPSLIPFSSATGSRRSVQNLVQFNSDHVIDVHAARVYPFDTYGLSTTVRALSFSNRTLPIRRLATIATTSSFDIESLDVESYSSLPNNTHSTSRDMDMRISRPGVSRALTLLLFAGAWMFAHLTLCLVIVARRLAEVRSTLKFLLVASIIFVAIPQIRSTMPDAPGLEGVLIDAIGFFPQMVVAGFSVIILLLMLISRELDNIRLGQPPGVDHTSSLTPIVPPVQQSPTTRANSSSTEMTQYDTYRPCISSCATCVLSHR